jgi:hypothetical protein
MPSTHLVHSVSDAEVQARPRYHGGMKKGALLLIVAIALGPGCAREETSRAESRVFFFSPPADFNGREQYFDNHHYVASFSTLGPEREGMIRFDHPYLNFSPSAWDPESRSLFTWKKNYRGRDHLMVVNVPSMEVEAVARFPESGGSPLLAFDTRRRRVLVAPKYGFGLEALRGAALERELYLYDLEQGRWKTELLEGVGLITLAYSEKLDRYVAFGKALRSPSLGGAGEREKGTGEMLFHLHPDGHIVKEVQTDLTSVLASPIVMHGPKDSLSANTPGVQSRVVGNELLMVRYVDLGRNSPREAYQWSYEVYAIDTSTGSSRFVRSFR